MIPVESAIGTKKGPLASQLIANLSDVIIGSVLSEYRPEESAVPARNEIFPFVHYMTE